MEDGGIVLVWLLSAKCCVQCMYFLMASVSSLIRNDKHFEFYILFYFLYIIYLEQKCKVVLPLI